MSELKVEDLKVGDKLEFISDDMRESFRLSSERAALIEGLFTPYNKVISVQSNRCFLEGSIGHKWFNSLIPKELKYFRKVEQVKENKPPREELCEDYQAIKDEQEVPTVLVDADIKDEKDMYTRMLNGEVFYYKDDLYSYNNNIFCFNNTKFTTYDK